MIAIKLQPEDFAKINSFPLYLSEFRLYFDLCLTICNGYFQQAFFFFFGGGGFVGGRVGVSFIFLKNYAESTSFYLVACPN